MRSLFISFLTLYLLTGLTGCQSSHIRVETTFPLYEQQLTNSFDDENWEQLAYLLKYPTEPTHLDYYRYLVKYHYQTKTLKALEKTYRNKPESFEKLYIMGLIHSIKGVYHIKTAMTLMERALKKCPPDIKGVSELHYNLAFLYEKRDKQDDAMKQLDIALKLDKRYKYLMLQAYIYVKQEQYLKAQNILNATFDQLKKRGDVEKSRRLMEHLLRERKNLAPKVKESYYNLLGFLQTGKHSNDIIKIGKQGIIDFPTISVYYTLLGLGYYMEDRRSDSARYFEKAIMIDPSDPFNYVHQGVLYNSLKQYRKAAGYFEKAIALNRYQPLPYNYLAKIALLHKNYSKAIIFKRAELKMIQNVEIYLDLELLLRRGGRLKEAKKLVEGLITRYPEEAKPYKRLVLIYELMLDDEEKPLKRKDLIKKINRLTSVFREKEGEAASKRLDKLKEDGI